MTNYPEPYSAHDVHGPQVRTGNQPTSETAATPAMQTPVHTGAVPWGIGFIAYIPIPFLNLLISGVTQIVVGLAQKKYGDIAAHNGTRAANWGVIQVLWFVGLIVIAAVGILSGISSGDKSVPFEPVYNGLGLTWMGLYILLNIVHVILTVWGLISASKGLIARIPTIPFFRAK